MTRGRKRSYGTAFRSAANTMATAYNAGKTFYNKYKKTKAGKYTKKKTGNKTKTSKPVRITETATNRVGTGIIQQNWSYGRKLKSLQKRLNKKSSPFFRLDNQATYITNSTGLQGAQLLTSAYTPYDIAKFNNGPLDTPGTWPGGPVTGKQFLGHCKLFIRGTNQSNCNATLELYNIIVRRDNFGATAEAQDPMTAWNQGLANVQGNLLVSSSQVGATPFASRAFCAYYKVAKKTVYHLSAGESFIHKCYLRANRTFNMEQLNANGPPSYNYQNTGGYRWLTHYIVAVYNTYPANEQVLATSVDAPITTDYRGRCDFEITKDYVSWQPLANNIQPQLGYYSTLATTVTAGNFAAVMDFQSGTAQQVAVA